MKADLTQLALDIQLDDGDLIVDAMLLLRVARTDEDGTALSITTTPGLDWMLQLGMVEAARAILGSPANLEDDE